MPTERITIVINEKGARVVQRQFSDTGGAAVKAASGVDVLKRALAGIGAGYVLRELLRLVDTYTNLQNRLRLVTNGTDDLATATRELLAVSNRTRSSFQNNAELFNRVSLATRELGVSQEQVIQFTESLNQAIQISGASAKEASTALIQLSQGLASNTLRGDELRSVLEQLPAVADVIAKEMGVTRGQLRIFGAQGKVTAGIVLEAFKNAREELAERFKKVIPTVGQAFQVLKNQVLGYVGAINESHRVSRSLAQLIIFLANNVDMLIKSLTILGVTLLSMKVSFSAAATKGSFFGLVL
ncbi:MAG: tape measure protein, partial [Desulfobacteraceae bacterium]